MTNGERALWLQAKHDYEHALAIAKEAWGDTSLPVEPTAEALQAATATLLIHVAKLRERGVVAPTAPAAVKRDGSSPAPSKAPVAVPPCPKCGGKMWDNRESKKKPTQPDFVCRDKACKDGKFITALWEKDLQQQSPKGGAKGLGQPMPAGGFDDFPEALDEEDDIPF